MQITKWVITQCCNSHSICLNIQWTSDLGKPATTWKTAIYYQVSSASGLPFRIYHIRKDFWGRGCFRTNYSVSVHAYNWYLGKTLMCSFIPSRPVFSPPRWITISTQYTRLLQSKWTSLVNSNFICDNKGSKCNAFLAKMRSYLLSVLNPPFSLPQTQAYNIKKKKKPLDTAMKRRNRKIKSVC